MAASAQPGGSAPLRANASGQLGSWPGGAEQTGIGESDPPRKRMPQTAPGARLARTAGWLGGERC